MDIWETIICIFIFWQIKKKKLNLNYFLIQCHNEFLQIEGISTKFIVYIF